VAPHLIKTPKAQRLQDNVTVEETQRLFLATRTLSYRLFFFILCSLDLRLGEGLRLQVGDIDAERRRVHIRDAKGNKDRLVPFLIKTHLRTPGLSKNRFKWWLRALRSHHLTLFVRI
jgi:integrase